MATIVLVELGPDLINGVLIDSVAFDFGGQSASKCFVSREDGVVDEDLKIRWEALPKDRVLIVEGLSVNDDHLLILNGLLRR